MPSLVVVGLTQGATRENGTEAENQRISRRGAARLGGARQGPARLCMARPRQTDAHPGQPSEKAVEAENQRISRRGAARRGWAWQGPARLGVAWPGRARRGSGKLTPTQGATRENGTEAENQRISRPGLALHGEAVQSEAWLGPARHGTGRPMSTQDSPPGGLSRLKTSAYQGSAGHGRAWLCSAGQSKALHDVTWHVVARPRSEFSEPCAAIGRAEVSEPDIGRHER